MITLVDAVETFNSLFEMLGARIAARLPATLRSFNSLFEMPVIYMGTGREGPGVHFQFSI